MDRNDDVYYTFWYWINERHRIYMKRQLAGQSKPWTDDPILQQWKFCNVFRNLDKQTQHLFDDVIKWDIPMDLMLFNIYAFRAFNWHDTFVALADSDVPYIKDWNFEVARRILDDRDCDAKKLTSGAYMIRGRQYLPKYESICLTLDYIWQDKEAIVEEIKELPLKSMELLQQLLMDKNYWGWGPFTTYQVVLDFSYTDYFYQPIDINFWCEFGPGAERGIKLIYPGAKPKDYLPLTRQLWERQSTHLEDHMPIMTLQDIEFSLCELSKYMRIKNGGKSKEKFNGSPD